jgi:2-polyprenyl-3-methyl-5-hydroxy-6-metoxy-1,4-benzoquinol methylase
VKAAAVFFEAYAAEFDAIYGTPNTPLNRVVNRLFRRSMRLRYERTLSGCEPVDGRTILDVGCGPGHYAVELARRGAARVVGIDFSPSMLRIARERAQAAGVADRCAFREGDFMAKQWREVFDYAVVMGFMDYAAEPKDVVDRVFSLTRSRAFFSFPAAGGLLAWQRRLRYRTRCPLFLYRQSDVRRLFEGSGEARLERIARDFFVTVTLEGLPARARSTAP